MKVLRWWGDGTRKMKKQIRKTWPIVAIIVSVVGLLLLYGPDFFPRFPGSGNPRLEEGIPATADLGYLRQQLWRAEALLKKEAYYRQRLAASREALARWEESLWSGPPEQATVELVTVVEKLAAGAGLTITNKALQPPRRGPAREGWQRIGVTIEGSTDYPRLTTFFNRLLASAKTIFIASLDLRLDEYTGALRFRIGLYSYTR